MTAEEARRAYWAACEKWQAVKDDPYSDYRQMHTAALEVKNARLTWEKAIARQRTNEPHYFERRRVARDIIAHQLDDAGMPVEMRRKGR